MYRYYKVSQSICDDDQLEYRYGVVCNTTYNISFSVERIKERIDEQSDVAVWVDIKIHWLGTWWYMFMVRRGTFERSISIATVPRIQYHCIPWHDSEMWETLPVAECNDSVTFKYHSSTVCCIVIHCYECKNIQFDAFVPFVACGATCIDPYLIVLAHNIHRQSPGWLWAVCWCCLWFL